MRLEWNGNEDGLADGRYASVSTLYSIRYMAGGWESVKVKVHVGLGRWKKHARPVPIMGARSRLLAWVALCLHYDCTMPVLCLHYAGTMLALCLVRWSYPGLAWANILPGAL